MSDSENFSLKTVSSDSDDSTSSVKLGENEKLWWYRDNANQNYRRPLMCADENGHIVEYLQLKITRKINVLIDQEHRANIKQYKFYLKDGKIVSDNGSIFEVLYPGVMEENIRFKNGSIYDLRKCNIAIE